MCSSVWSRNRFWKQQREQKTGGKKPYFKCTFSLFREPYQSLCFQLLLSLQVLSTSDFLDERQLGLQLSSEEVLSITSAQFHLTDGSEYGCQVVGVRREFDPDSASVRTIYLSTPSGVEIEVGTDGDIVARGAEVGQRR